MTYSLEEIRQFFPICQETIYLNNAAVAPTSTLAIQASNNWLEDLASHGIHEESEWEEHSDCIRRATANLIGAKENEIAFVRNTSHGLALVAEGIEWEPNDEVALCTNIEYPSNIYVWENLKRFGVHLVNIPSTHGGITPQAVESVLSPKTKLLAVSAVQYATGHTSDLQALGKLCQQNGTLLCVDGIQRIGSSPLDVKELGIHFLAADSHKWMLGMMGIGLLFIDEAILPKVRPALVGWKSTIDAFNFDQALFQLKEDASKFEEGSPNYAGIYGMGAAINLLQTIGLPRIESHIRDLLQYAANELESLGCTVSPEPRFRSGILMVTPPHDDAAGLYTYLNEHNIRVSLRRGRIRISPHIYNSRDEITALIAKTQNYLEQSEELT